MKTIITTIILLLSIGSASSQQILDNIDLTIREDPNPGGLGDILVASFGYTAYTVYARPVLSYTEGYDLGSTQTTIVLPEGLTYYQAVGPLTGGTTGPMNVQPNEGGVWANQDVIEGFMGLDYHAIFTGGATLTEIPMAGEEIKLYSVFVLGECNEGIRLFINGTDPGSAEMPGGGDFANNFIHQVSGGVQGDEYRMNYITGGSICLPIELLSFDARKSGNTTIVNWVTLTELNNDYYEVERSSDGKEFRVIGKVSGAGTDYNKNTYSFVDERPHSGINYYRLKQVDYDEQYSYSRIKSVYFEDAGIAMSVYPNPARDEVELTTGKKAGAVMLQMIDSKGQIVYENNYLRGDWIPSQRLDISDMVEGMYMIVLKEGNSSDTARFVKVK